jgi:hypothetical protein
MSTAVAKAKTTELSSDVMDDIFDYAGEGASFDSSEMIIPFVRVAQSLSPQINKKKPEFIEGLSVGDAYNNVTGEWWPGETGLIVVPCYQVTKYLEFVPRESGGGFVGEVAPNDSRIQQTTRVGSKELLPNGNELVKSDQHFCIVVAADGMTQPVVVDMKSTQLKVSRRWKTQIAMKKVRHPKDGRMITPPVFASTWRLRVVEETNDKGDFYNWVVEPVGLVEDREVLLEAKAFRDSVAAGEVKAQAEVHPEAYRPDDQGAPIEDGDIPF